MDISVTAGTSVIFLLMWVVVLWVVWVIIRPQVHLMRFGVKPKLWPFVIAGLIVITMVLAPLKLSERDQYRVTIERFDQEVHRGIEVERIERNQYQPSNNDEVINQLYR